MFFFYNHHFQGWVVLKRMGVHFLYPYTPVKLIFNHCSSDKENGNGIYDETHNFFFQCLNENLKCLPEMFELLIQELFAGVVPPQFGFPPPINL